MERQYVVANHRFALIMDKSDTLWGMLSAYDPFVVSDRGDNLFSVTIQQDVERGDANLTFSEESPEEGFFRVDIYRSETGHYIELYDPFKSEQCAKLTINNERTIFKAALCGSDAQRVWALNTVLTMSYMFATIGYSTIFIHASAVMVDGYAYLFIAKSGTGKSTHSRMWLESIEGAELLNDDHPIIRINQQGEVIAYGSPWSGKTPCYRNLSAPIGGIARIKRSSVNKLCKLNTLQSYASLITSCSGMSWEESMADAKSDTVEKIISSVGCYTIECLPDNDAARVCYDGITRR